MATGILTAAFGVGLGATSPAQAAEYDAGGFDSTGRFAPNGALVDQDGGSTWNEAAGFATTATVKSNANSPSGAVGQTVQVFRAANEFGEWWVSNVTGPATNQTKIAIDWRIKVAATGSTVAYGPMFGIFAGDGSQPGVPRLAGLFVDAYDGTVLVAKSSLGGDVDVSALTVSLSNWNSFTMILNFSGVGPQVQLFANGSSTAFYTDSFADAGVTGFTDAAIFTSSAASDDDSLVQTGTAWFDSYRVRTLLMGDANGDGTVSSLDSKAVEAAFGQLGTGAGAGDANHDGVVNGLDYRAVEQYLGATYGSPLPTPEPSVASLLLLTLTAAAARRRRLSH